MSYHFTNESPAEHVFTDIQALNKFETGQFHQIAEIVISFLTDSDKSSRLLSDIGEFSEQHGVNPAALKTHLKGLLLVTNSGLRRNLGPAQLKDDLQKLGLSEDKASYMADQWKLHLVALSKSALGQTLMVNQLVDMEWKFGVTAASSELKKVGNTFLQLKLVINKGNKMENVYMELTLPQFYSFLHEMEKAKASLEYFT